MILYAAISLARLYLNSRHNTVTSLGQLAHRCPKGSRLQAFRVRTINPKVGGSIPPPATDFLSISISYTLLTLYRF